MRIVLSARGALAAGAVCLALLCGAALAADGEHPELFAAMRALFDERWQRQEPFGRIEQSDGKAHIVTLCGLRASGGGGGWTICGAVTPEFGERGLIVERVDGARRSVRFIESDWVNTRGLYTMAPASEGGSLSEVHFICTTSVEGTGGREDLYVLEDAPDEEDAGNRGSFGIRRLTSDAAAGLAALELAAVWDAERSRAALLSAADGTELASAGCPAPPDGAEPEVVIEGGAMFDIGVMPPTVSFRAAVRAGDNLCRMRDEIVFDVETKASGEEGGRLFRLSSPRAVPAK